MKISKTLLLVAGLGACASASFAQVGTGGTISNGFTNFTIGDYLGDGTGSGPLADMRVGGTGNPDHLYNAWWWFRQGGDSRELAFSNAITSTNTGNTMRLDYVYADFTATMTFHVTGINNGLGFLTQQMTIRNTTDHAISVDLFNRSDIDMNGTFGDDTLTPAGPNIVRFWDAGGATGWRADYEGTEAYAFDSSGSVTGMLTDNAITDFAGTGGTRPLGDWEGAFQWTLNLSANEAATASATITIIPAPGAMGLGLVGLVAATRRRRS